MAKSTMFEAFERAQVRPGTPKGLVYKIVRVMARQAERMAHARKGTVPKVRQQRQPQPVA